MFTRPKIFVSPSGALELNREFLLFRGVNPDSDDDSSFPTELIYCHGHGRIHAKGLCTVTNALKLPADESLPECYRRADH